MMTEDDHGNSWLRNSLRVPRQFVFGSGVRSHLGLLLSISLYGSEALAQDAGASLESSVSPSTLVTREPINLGAEEPEIPKALYVMDLDPSDYLDKVSQNTKARWRQHYREAPPAAPPADRFRVAFLLGGLMADTYLAQQAKDSQQFKNVNQDVLKHANALALGDRMEPIVLVESKMAESEDWIALRAKLFQTQEQVDQWLHEQRDEDLAILVTLGIWLRLFQVTANIAAEDLEMSQKTLAVGSLAQLEALCVLFDQCKSSNKEKDSTLSTVGKLLNFLRSHWIKEDQEVTKELLTATKERIDNLWKKMSEVK